MRTLPNVVIRVVPWSPGYGARSKLDVAWFHVRGIPLENRNCPTASFAGSLVGKTMVVDRFSLNNVDYIRVSIGNMDVSLVPPVVPNVNIGTGFCDIEFTREIVRGKQIHDKNSVLIDQWVRIRTLLVGGIWPIPLRDLVQIW